MDKNLKNQINENMAGLVNFVGDKLNEMINMTTEANSVEVERDVVSISKDLAEILTDLKDRGIVSILPDRCYAGINGNMDIRHTRSSIKLLEYAYDLTTGHNLRINQLFLTDGDRWVIEASDKDTGKVVYIDLLRVKELVLENGRLVEAANDEDNEVSFIIETLKEMPGVIMVVGSVDDHVEVVDKDDLIFDMDVYMNEISKSLKDSRGELKVLLMQHGNLGIESYLTEYPIDLVKLIYNSIDSYGALQHEEIIQFLLELEVIIKINSELMQV